MPDPYYRLSRDELAMGWVTGLLAPGAPPLAAPSPVAAMEAAILPALLRGPCFVAFSGGRDSSAILAVAARLARREGLPEPIAITERFPEAPSTDESSWQQAVIDHVGVREWVRLEIRNEHDMLGDGVRDSLRRRGVVWPATAHTTFTLFEQAAGGTLLTGEGGDEVFGARRLTPLVKTVRRREWPRRARLASIAEGLALRPARAARLSRRFIADVAQPWVRPGERRRIMHAVAADYASEPLAWDAGARWLLSRKPVQVSSNTMKTIAADSGVTWLEPLLDPAFVDAIARLGGRFGFSSRNELMGRLFGDVLPVVATTRVSKVSFNSVYTGESLREFARTWDGGGVDGSVVDSEALRREWLSDTPSGLTFPLLHTAWLASQAGGMHERTPLDAAG